jgi:excisionase family DNA binding protein
MSDPQTTLITIREAAERRGVHRSRMYQYVDEGRIQTIRCQDGLQRVRVADVDSLQLLPRGRRVRE